MLSMTGFGRFVYCGKDISATVEIKTVNNRYSDINIKCPRIFSGEEEGFKERVRNKMTRGHADVFISFRDNRQKQKNLNLDESVARAYKAAADRIKEIFPDVQNDITVSAILRYPDVIKADDETTADGELNAAVYCALEGAIEELNKMRAVEGGKLKDDMLSRMKVIEELVKNIEGRAPQVAENYRQKLLDRMKKILDGVDVDETRILTEAALFSDKCNIDEEITRLKSHISQFRKICEEEVVGRKLDFLVQEFNREANTICSKSNDLEVTRLGLALKNEIEKVREQVQNVE